MRRFRFHIGTLVILVLLLGVGFADLRESNETWDSSIFSLTLVVLSISILLAIHRTNQRQAFWLGFALFGSAYLGLSLVPSLSGQFMRPMCPPRISLFQNHPRQPGPVADGPRGSLGASRRCWRGVMIGSSPSLITLTSDPLPALRVATCLWAVYDRAQAGVMG
jgi:hypothetical protein